MATGTIPKSEFVGVLVLGTDSSPITNLSDIPINSSGLVFLGSSLRPNSNVSSYVYFCYGTNLRKIIICSLTTVSIGTYLNAYDNGTWRGWKTVTLT